jgi:hypothetical protein
VTSFFFFGRIIKHGVKNFRSLGENLAMLYGFIPSIRDKNPFEKVPFLWFISLGEQRNEQ